MTEVKDTNNDVCEASKNCFIKFQYSLDFIFFYNYYFIFQSYSEVYE